jgi:hypothetical protein
MSVNKMVVVGSLYADQPLYGVTPSQLTSREGRISSGGGGTRAKERDVHAARKKAKVAQTINGRTAM